jgi:hypothetical protein
MRASGRRSIRERLAVDGEDADHAPLTHPVEVAGPFGGDRVERKPVRPFAVGACARTGTEARSVIATPTAIEMDVITGHDIRDPRWAGNQKKSPCQILFCSPIVDRRFSNPRSVQSEWRSSCS